MPTLATHKQFQDIRRLPFCYLCGCTFVQSDAKDRDHVPPKTCFAKTDRNVPLALPTHVSCNHSHHLTDEKIGQVISLKRGAVPGLRNRRIAISVFPPNAHRGVLGAITNIDIKGAIRRWIRGFHAALYSEPLHDATQFGINTPFPTAQLSQGALLHDPILPQHRLFVKTLKVNRSVRNVDRIESNNGKMEYECVWQQSDTGSWMCIFGLNIYDWKDMGAIQSFPARGCVGFYATPSGSAPSNATRATAISVLIPNYDPLDAFGR